MAGMSPFPWSFTVALQINPMQDNGRCGENGRPSLSVLISQAVKRGVWLGILNVKSSVNVLTVLNLAKCIMKLFFYENQILFSSVLLAVVMQMQAVNLVNITSDRVKFTSSLGLCDSSQLNTPSCIVETDQDFFDEALKQAHKPHMCLRVQLRFANVYQHPSILGFHYSINVLSNQRVLSKLQGCKIYKNAIEIDKSCRKLEKICCSTHC